VRIAASHYLKAAETASTVADVLAERLAAATNALATAQIDHVQLTEAYFETRRLAAEASEDACRSEQRMLAELETQSVSDADKLAATAFPKGKGGVLSLGDITGVHSGAGAGAPPPVADGPLKTLAKIDDHVVTYVRESSLQAAQAEAHAAEMQAIAAAADAQAANERSKLSVQRVATVASSAPNGQSNHQNSS
jgi:hypothetical protein